MAVRAPAVAGRFYPGSAEELRSDVERYTALEVRPEPAVAAVMPHAGYIYSGGVAGQVLASIEIPPEVLILGPNHTGLGVPLSLYPGGSTWETPLGEVAISDRLNEVLLEVVPGLEEDTEAHAKEHSAEVQVPFLQSRAPEVRISVLRFGTGRLETLLEVGMGIAMAVASSPRPVLILASSDMSHYETHEVAVKKDRLAIDEVLRLDPEGLHRVCKQTPVTMCGYAGTVAALRASKALGAKEAWLVDYRTSGDTTGDRSSVVGYAGIVIR